MRTLSIDEFHQELAAQKAPTIRDLAFVCPMCGTVQSANTLIAAGAGKTFDDVERYLAFSCVGRFLNAQPPRKKPDGKPCNWTLGGLFKTHTLQVVDRDGNLNPRFEIASRQQAEELWARTPAYICEVAS